MASNYTENYGLCQWEATDQVLRTEFNEDNAKLDDALGIATAAITALGSQLEKKGNCQIEIFTYTGTGSYGQSTPTQINFSDQPAFFLILGTHNYMMGQGGYDKAMATTYNKSGGYTGVGLVEITWDGNQLQYYSNSGASYQYNEKDTVYRIISLYSVS